VLRSEGRRAPRHRRVELPRATPATSPPTAPPGAGRVDG
jgi:hypothetical protein